MRICWYDDHKLGLVKDGRVHDVSLVLKELPAPSYPPRVKGDLLIAHLDSLRPAILKAAERSPGVDVKSVKFLPPVATPTKIIGTPANYAKHHEEAQHFPGAEKSRYAGPVREQGLFLKATSALIGGGDTVKLRFPDRRSDHEMELGVVIGRTASNVSEADALKYVAGYAIALDMVVRGKEDRSFRKSIDTYAVLGPWLTTADEVPDPGHLDFSLKVNGEVRQASNTALMLVNLPEQIAWASQWYTLYPGDIIMTGTCEGVSRVAPGDVMSCWIDGVAEMDVRVG